MRKIFLFFVFLFVFNSSINAQDNPSNSIDTKAKNIIKTNVFGILTPTRDLSANSFDLLLPPLSYERVINNKFSLYIEVKTEIHILTEKTAISDYYNLNVDVAFRYYLSDSAPIGVYLSPSLQLYRDDFTDLVELNLLFGYQNIIPGTDIYFDLALGIKYRWAIRYRYDRDPIGPTGLFSVGYPF
ncbi:hypothetical protein [Ichthyobacterium seriolicida]|uniref:Secreted protein n=1 Tax=Ichthyobacterium seriolicida TaxID=242600 RepID=A0A1J1EAR9_9FLAO|nr:hypothetical protein [Ichthyobacterium seriolicida]BAV95035.1 hypothetical protein JBKA6_1022 [Ichthyobacterium seriolicida]